MENMIWQPSHQYQLGGNQVQLCESTYKGIKVTWRTYFPWNIFKNPTDTFILDLILPMETGKFMDDGYYTNEGFGVPVFVTLDEAVRFIDEQKLI